MNLPLAPLAAAVLGGAAALGVVLMPVDVIEGLVMDSGLPAVVQAAEPPLGHTARILLGGGVGLFVALFSWLTLFVLFGSRGVSVAQARHVVADDDMPPAPVIRRADAHPDAPPRPPLLATRDLGEPVFELSQPAVAEPETIEPLFAPRPTPVRLVERPLPANLDQPLAAFDPDAIPDMPMPPPVPIAPLRRARPAVFDESERFEVFELTPPYRQSASQPAPTRPAAIARPETDASVHALLERLERGVVRTGLAAPTRSAPPKEAERGLEEALVTLRNLARRTA